MTSTRYSHQLRRGLDLRDCAVDLARMLAELRAELVDVEQSRRDGRTQFLGFAIEQLELVVDMATMFLADVAHEGRDATLLLKTRELDRMLRVHLCLQVF